MRNATANSHGPERAGKSVLRPATAAGITRTVNSLRAALRSEPGCSTSISSARRVWMLSALALLPACASGSASSDSVEVTSASLELALRVADCRQDVKACLQNATDPSERAQCAVVLESCITQAAADGVGQGTLLADCRSNVDQCLSGAIGVTDITACRHVHSACLTDVVQTARDTVASSLDEVAQAIDTSVVAVEDRIPAVKVLSACRADVTTCLEDALTLMGVASCRDVLDSCVSGVADAVDRVAGALPRPRQLLDATKACRAETRECLVDAASSADIKTCRGMLQTCVSAAEDLVADVVGPGGIIDLETGLIGVVVPKPSEVLDCSDGLRQCLFSLKSPFDCASEARDCIKP